MAGRIPSQFIDQLLSQADIVDVISNRIPLKKAGREFHACCPFHHEKTPSFTVSPSKQFYHCFGCGAHGSALSFIMEYDNLAFPDAVEELAKGLGLEVPREEGQAPGPDYRPLYELLEKCRQFYSWQLRNHAQAAMAVDYLKQRGLSGEIAATYQIGFAPPGWDNLMQHFGMQPKIIKQLVETGMITDAEGKQYDRFRERIMFPIRDRRGRVIGFGGRILGDGKPKYLNSPETPLFHKGRELYGLYEARQAHKQLQRLLVVEGYMDVVALAQFGIDYCVATLGTATTSHHLELIYRNTPEVVFCFDGDRAGRDAAGKALEICLPQMRDGKQARFMFLPEGEDPDTLVRKEGKQAFEQRIDNAVPLSEFLQQKIAEQVDMRSLDGRARFAELIKPFVEQIPQGLFKQMLQQQIDETTGLARSGASNKNRRFSSQQLRHNNAPQSTTLLRKAIWLLLHHPEKCRDIAIPELTRQSDQPGIDLLLELYDYSHHFPDKPLGAVLEHWRDHKDFTHLDRIARMDLDIVEQDVADQFQGVLAKIVKEQAEREWQRLTMHKSLSELSESDKQRIKELQTVISLNTDDRN
ncbi:MAG: DNA primase [Chromatiales bacterium]|jgi:DNA primase